MYKGLDTLGRSSCGLWCHTGADPRGGQRGQLTPPPESYQGSQKNDV